MTLEDYELSAEILFGRLQSGELSERDYERHITKLDEWYTMQTEIDGEIAVAAGE